MTGGLHLLWFWFLMQQLCSTAGVESCKVEELSPLSAYVTASFEQSVSVTGCIGQELSSNLLSVYVVSLANWNGSRNQNLIVDLYLQNLTGRDDRGKQIFVLASVQPVIWRLFTDVKHRVFYGKLVISNQSQISHSLRLKYKPRHVAVPFKGDAQKLENWVRQKWGAVTAFAYLPQPANWVMIPLASASRSNVACRIQMNFPEIRAGNVNKQTIWGCTESAKETTHERDVHIVELLSASFDVQKSYPLPVVELSIKSKIRKQLFIILKCRHPVKWKISTSRVKGSINFITDRPIDSSGIKARHFRIAAERIHALTGQDLISWSAEKYGPITSYSLATVANKVELTTDAEDRVHNQTAYSTVSTAIEMSTLNAHNGRNSVADDKKRLKRLIIHALSLSCKESSMRISIWKFPFRNFPLSIDNISFLDLSCQAVDAGAQLLLSTRYSECGTLHSVTRDGTAIFTNAVVVRPQISESSTLKPKSLADLKMPIVINVSCHYLEPQKNDNSIRLSTVQFEMSIYKDKDYSSEVVEFPMFLRPSDELFVEIQASGYDNLNIVLRNCSLESEGGLRDRHLKERWLFINGCAADETWKWMNDGTRNFSRQERFSFGFSESFGVNSVINLKCSIVICAHLPDHSIPELTLCSSELQYCDFDNHFNQSKIVTHLMKGPFLLLPAEEGAEPDIAELHSHVTKETFLPVAINQDADQPISMDKAHAACTGMVLVDGVTTGAVIGISFAAFFIGVLLMSSLWYIHVRTGPRKKIGLRASDSKSIKSKLFCSDSRALQGK